ncbi:ribosomal protein 60S [Hanseniaspora valbyensis NRRL Y-1626]|uniref:Ribosomal protein 60S n=1 Tax=Hanseniaspora valbyensis NRRL Y-1626 TaxID=766949 RepID=A0A1B7TDG3_9ASCO|nr:ribosomal protein 60S [Hanseniaspora valbyensis NRRL Y-1626]
MSTESALSFAALILSDADIEITSENLLKLVAAAGVEVEFIFADIFAKAIGSQDINALLTNFSAAPAAAGAAAGSAAAGGADAAAEEEKEESAAEESDDDMGFGLFD